MHRCVAFAVIVNSLLAIGRHPHQKLAIASKCRDRTFVLLSAKRINAFNSLSLATRLCAGVTPATEDNNWK